MRWNATTLQLGRILYTTHADETTAESLLTEKARAAAAMMKVRDAAEILIS